MLIKEELYIDVYDTYRTMHIYLPDDIGDEERLEVIYMFDGHNLYLDEDATYGTSWGLMEDLSKLNARVMIVGIECNHEGNMRLSEFSPHNFEDPYFGYVKGMGKELFKWIVNALKPYIDEHYPTLKERKYTSIGGSSMGGLMALYGGIAYSEVFSKALCISPYVYYVSKNLVGDIRRKEILNDTRFYVSFGSEEVNSKRGLVSYVNELFKVQRKLNEKALIYMHIYKGRHHCEAAWRKETPVWYKELHYL